MPLNFKVTQTVVYETGKNMLIGYARVSKSDGSQNLDLQIDALKKAGVSDLDKSGVGKKIKTSSLIY